MKYAIIISITLLMAACNGKPAEDDAVADTGTVAQSTATGDELTITPEQLRSMGLQLGSAAQTTVSDEVKTTGTVDVPPQYMASVSPLIAGVIKRVNVLPGQRIGKGATLATLQSLDYIQMQQDYLQAISQLTYQQAELQRQKTLNAEEVGARKRLQQAEADYTSNRALVSSLALKLQTLGTSVETLKKGELSSVMRIVSPVAGYVTASNVHLGQQVATTDVLFQVMDQAHKHLELNVFENDAFKIKNGQTILLNDPKLGAETVRGRVYLVGKAFEGEARTINVHGHIENEGQESRLIPGMFLNARILTGSRVATTLPEEAVVRKGQNGFVYVSTAKARTYRRVPVKLGQVEQGRVEVIPLKPTDLTKVVVKGAYVLEAEMTKGEGEEE
ncbi:efflux RND transporter periplasmic adaptor subunit [Spirosoma taeanense]|uniref:Efflux RND transporter periplasmic adaptor subunit n=1 Tax=Spirosoma taeanense TaxID=2735870 RepID=A0A6M5YED6_9BACT|nr:efflux RND transporter periplasmic adaptor subunit [Spirosoma taeanense]QJW91653.1 efflux RND transporter periplasmic adaptor subunit [Spirosoma taeanense]